MNENTYQKKILTIPNVLQSLWYLYRREAGKQNGKGTVYR